MRIISYREGFKQQVIDLILHIQNEEAKINLALQQQPDLLDIKDSYISRGGEFLVAIENGAVIGTIAFMNYGDHNAVLKKFFVQAEYRSQGIGLALYKKLLGVLVEQGYKKVLLDTPAVAVKSHHFYEKAGFKMISKQELPFHYEYPDRDSLLYLLVL